MYVPFSKSGICYAFSLWDNIACELDEIWRYIWLLINCLFLMYARTFKWYYFPTLKMIAANFQVQWFVYLLVQQGRRAAAPLLASIMHVQL
jgi:hypothetical protein